MYNATTNTLTRAAINMTNARWGMACAGVANYMVLSGGQAGCDPFPDMASNLDLMCRQRPDQEPAGGDHCARQRCFQPPTDTDAHRACLARCGPYRRSQRGLSRRWVRLSCVSIISIIIPYLANLLRTTSTMCCATIGIYYCRICRISSPCRSRLLPYLVCGCLATSSPGPS